MGYSTRNNGQIKDFQPDNDANTLYVKSAFENGMICVLSAKVARAFDGMED